MAGLADIIRNAVAIADSATDTLQPKVRHAAWIGNDGEGGYQYASAVQRPALVERKQKLVRKADGEQVLSTHVVTFLRPIKKNGAAGRQEPIDPRDRITLPDGTTSNILSVNAFVDKDTGAGYLHEVYLG
jgi:hypothetical protein